MKIQSQDDVIIVGGGLAGLSAAVLLAKSGKKVRVFERANTLGGRGVTQEEADLLFNLGPHALYRKGPAHALLKRLGVKIKGKMPNISGNEILWKGQLHPMPTSPGTVFSTDLFNWSGRMELIRKMLGVVFQNHEPQMERSIGDWLANEVQDPFIRDLLAGLFRLSTYANDPERLSAGGVLKQFRLALTGNVLYLDNGWQTMVDGLVQKAQQFGVELEVGRAVQEVLFEQTTPELHKSVPNARHRVQGVLLKDGSYALAKDVILAVGPSVATKMANSERCPSLQIWAKELIPIRAACLDLALDTLPCPKRPFVLGLDKPYYFSVHTEYARLGGGAGHVVHVAKYRHSDEESAPKEIESELESFMDIVQPGWREHVRFRRFMPKMLVANALLSTDLQGGKGRPDVHVPEAEGLYLAGDWVGKGYWNLLDASLDSAKTAVDQIIKRGSLILKKAA